MNASELYDKKFFDFMNACRTNYRKLADCIHEICQPYDSVIDLGCGTGLVIERLQELSEVPCAGYDAFGTSDTFVIRKIDLTIPQVFERSAGLVICTETAEHLPEKAAHALVVTVASAATKMIVWSAADVGANDAVGHINEQPPQYWLEKFALLGWVPQKELTDQLRVMMRNRHAQHEYCANCFYILVRT